MISMTLSWKMNHYTPKALDVTSKLFFNLYVLLVSAFEIDCFEPYDIVALY